MLSAVDTVVATLVAVLAQRDACIGLTLLDMVSIAWPRLVADYAGESLDHPQVITLSLG